MDENPGSDAYSKKSGAAETLVQKNQSNSQLERISETSRSTLLQLEKTPPHPLAYLIQTEERIKEQADLNNEWETRVNLWTYEINIPKDTGFCRLATYKHSNCNGRRYVDDNCFEIKTPGCRDGRIYLKIKKILKNENISLFMSSYISKSIDCYTNLIKSINKKIEI